MGRALLIIVLVAGLVYSLSSLQMNVMIKSSTDNAFRHYEESVARNIAKAGIEMCIMRLDSSQSWRTGYSALPMSDGTMSAIVNSYDLDHVKIVSTGMYLNRLKTITAIVQIPPNDLPEPFNDALASDGPLSLNGTVDVVLENPSLQLNANIHSNTSITTGTQVHVAGFGTSAGSITANPISKLPEIFVPNYNPDGDPAYSQNISPINVPDFNADQYKAIADEVYEGDYTLSGNEVVGSLSDPKIIWIGGNMTLTGNVSLTGAGIYIVKGSITMNGNVSINNGVGEKSNLAFYSQNTITINGNPSVEGQFYAKNDFAVNGNATITGNVVVKNSDITVTTVSGSALIRYRPANSLLTSPIWTTNPRPNLSSYWE